jgi:hypothetical protein
MFPLNYPTTFPNPATTVGFVGYRTELVDTFMIYRHIKLT